MVPIYYPKYLLFFLSRCFMMVMVVDLVALLPNFDTSFFLEKENKVIFFITDVTFCAVAVETAG